MSLMFETIERLKSKGISAWQRGDFASARPCFIEAADHLLKLAEQAPSESVRRQREEIAAEMISLARECDERRKEPVNNRKPKQSDQDEDKGANASDWIVQEKPDIGFDDIAGLEDIKQEIRMRMIYPFSHPELAKEYGIQLGGGLLLYGPPGTGKTMIAKAIAREVDAAFFVVSPAQLLSKWVGEAEQNIRKLFECAKSFPLSVIFLDEIEALVPRRQSGSSTVMQRVVPQILQELEGFDRNADRAILFIGATNKPWLLDEAMLRPGRFDTRVYVGLPDPPARMKLLDIHLSKRPLGPDVDFHLLCDKLEGYSGADIKNMAMVAAQRPFMEAVTGSDPRPISMSDIEAVLASIKPSVQASDLVRFHQFEETGR